MLARVLTTVALTAVGLTSQLVLLDPARADLVGKPPHPCVTIGQTEVGNPLTGEPYIKQDEAPHAYLYCP